MATTTPTKPRPARRAAARPANGSKMELWTWYFMRLSGIVLVFLVLGHFTIVHLIDTGVDRVDFAFVSGRWSSPFWQTYDAAMLVLGLMHGANGMRVVVEDYVRPSRAGFYKGLLYTSAFAMLVLGLLIIITFDPNRGVSTVLKG
ncbi:MAG TPA: succinate dehydrogenase hydrophobic membrane anchor subunit [Actinomycetota bacterium]|nr:succinate dehydrogenase hydrophobic membrane anchor subunit [Actinomycetota bacterium]